MPTYTLEYTPKALELMKSNTLKAGQYADFIYAYTRVVEGHSEHPVPVFVFAKELNQSIEYGLKSKSNEDIQVMHEASSIYTDITLCLDNPPVAVADYLAICSAGKASNLFNDLGAVIPSSTLTAVYAPTEDTKEISVIMCLHVIEGHKYLNDGAVAINTPNNTKRVGG